MTDLFSWTPPYPKSAGWKESATSRDAARAIESTGRAETLRRKVLAYFASGTEATADETAEAIGATVLATRPRIAELHKQGRLEPTGARRTNDSGASAKVWRAAP